MRHRAHRRCKRRYYWRLMLTVRGGYLRRGSRPGSLEGPAQGNQCRCGIANRCLFVVIALLQFKFMEVILGHLLQAKDFIFAERIVA